MHFLHLLLCTLALLIIRVLCVHATRRVLVSGFDRLLVALLICIEVIIGLLLCSLDVTSQLLSITIILLLITLIIVVHLF